MDTLDILSGHYLVWGFEAVGTADPFICGSCNVVAMNQRRLYPVGVANTPGVSGLWSVTVSFKPMLSNHNRADLCYGCKLKLTTQALAVIVQGGVLPCGK